ncbi:MAG TPA: Os1348 family NHLP clan protein [Thermoanaerobaculia bacterium]
MSQRSVEKLLGRILTDDDFRRSFFPVRSASFEIAAAHGLDLTPIERSALSSLRLRSFECLARALDPRISRSSASADPVTLGSERAGTG